MSMDRTTARLLHQETAEALQQVAARHGLTVTLGGGSYGETFAVKVTYQAADAPRQMFQRYATLFGLTPEDYGRTFTHRGNRFEVVGLNPKAPRYPVEARRVSDGKAFKFPSSTVRMAR